MGKRRKNKRRRKKKKNPIDIHQIGLDELVIKYSNKPCVTILAVNEEYPNNGNPVGEYDLKMLDIYDCLRYVEYKSRYSTRLYAKAVKQLTRWIKYESSRPKYQNQTLIGLFYSPQTGLERVIKYKNNQWIRK